MHLFDCIVDLITQIISFSYNSDRLKKKDLSIESVENADFKNNMTM
jgi:hypothetical protein